MADIHPCKLSVSDIRTTSAHFFLNNYKSFNSFHCISYLVSEHVLAPSSVHIDLTWSVSIFSCCLAPSSCTSILCASCLYASPSCIAACVSSLLVSRSFRSLSIVLFCSVISSSYEVSLSLSVFSSVASLRLCCSMRTSSVTRPLSCSCVDVRDCSMIISFSSWCASCEWRDDERYQIAH